MIRTLFGIIRFFFIRLFNDIKIGNRCRLDLSSDMMTEKNSKIIIGDRFFTRNRCDVRAVNGWHLYIGNDVFLNNNVNIVAMREIKIGNNVKIGHNVLIIDHDHDYLNDIDSFNTDSIEIGDGTWIGAGVIILKGVKIGCNCVIAAGTILTKNVDSNSIVLNKLNTTTTSIRKEE